MLGKKIFLSLETISLSLAAVVFCQNVLFFFFEAITFHAHLLFSFHSANSAMRSTFLHVYLKTNQIMRNQILQCFADVFWVKAILICLVQSYPSFLIIL